MRGILPQAMQDVSDSRWRDVGLMWAMGIGLLFAACVWTIFLLMRETAYLPVAVMRFLQNMYRWCREYLGAVFQDRYDYPD